MGTEHLERAAALAPGTGRALVKALRNDGLVEASGSGAWIITQAGRTFSAATAAKLITRATAERALAQFLEGVTRVNENPYFLGKVTRVVLFGSMLKAEVESAGSMQYSYDGFGRVSKSQQTTPLGGPLRIRSVIIPTR